jgi:hypothetical protein
LVATDLSDPVFGSVKPANAVALNRNIIKKANKRFFFITIIID